MYIKKILTLLLMISLSAACTSTSTNESTGEFIDSSAITTKVKARLVQDENVNAFDINVKTFKGEVLLSGFVDSYEEKWKAGSIADQVAGVTSVENNIEVK